MSAEFRRAAEALAEPGGVVELRALKNGTTAGGYFDNPDALFREAAKLEEQGFTVYVAINPVKPALLARAANRIKRPPKETTSDKDVLRRRWLLVDADPNLPAGISASEEEKRATLRRAREVYGYLKGRGWPEPIAGDSGNGAHLLYAVDLPNNAESLQLVREVLEALSFIFSDREVKIDTSVCNAARISKLYGTTARKGDSTEDRPHRVSKLLKVPDERVEVSREQLAALVATMPEKPRHEPRERTRFDLDAWISEHAVPVKREGPWQQGYRYVLEACPWNGHTDNAAYIVRFASGAIAAGCHHNSCQEYGWRELREHYEPGAYERGGYQRNGHADHTGPTGILLSEVVPERVRWLWKDRIALGKLNLVDGDPGTGKSAATTDLAARVSVGKPWPDGSGCEAGGVVILSAEDGLADTIRPRFDAAGGDAAKAVAVSTVPDAEGNERQIAIPDDLHVIEAAIERVGAVLVVIDPLMAFLPGEVNSHRDQDVRRGLGPLARLAERTGAAIVVVRHLNKGTGGNALYRGGGSIGIVGAARSGLLIAKHPEDDGRRVLASIKSNLAPPAPSLVFGLSSTESGAVRVDWKGESDLDAEALLSAPTDHEERSALSEAQEFLREILSGGPVPAREAQDDARNAGIADRTLKRARQSLGVVAERQGEPGHQGGGRWYWKLPGIKGATLKGWHSKLAPDRTDGENTAYLSENGAKGLRGPSTDDDKGAECVGPLNRPLSADLRPSESATLEELRTRREGCLTSQDVRKLFSKPPGWLQDQAKHCRRQGAPENLVKALAASVAAELCGDSTRGGEVCAAVEAQFHEVGCDCEECG
jgi:hypothetical protein